MMGAGKTTVGLELSKALTTYKLIDIDSEIEKMANLKISEIFEKFGEEHFRQMETDFLGEICKNNKQILATGGGIFEREENRNLLKSCGTVYYLKASAETLFNRIKNQTHRPLLKNDFGAENIKSILEKRESNYSKADIIIDTENKPLYNIIKDIIEKEKINEQ